MNDYWITHKDDDRARDEWQSVRLLAWWLVVLLALGAATIVTLAVKG